MSELEIVARQSDLDRYRRPETVACECYHRTSGGAGMARSFSL